jgi:hypothetical protein
MVWRLYKAQTGMRLAHTLAHTHLHAHARAADRLPGGALDGDGLAVGAAEELVLLLLLLLLLLRFSAGAYGGGFALHSSELRWRPHDIPRACARARHRRTSLAAVYAGAGGSLHVLLRGPAPAYDIAKQRRVHRQRADPAAVRLLRCMRVALTAVTRPIMW